MIAGAVGQVKNFITLLFFTILTGLWKLEYCVNRGAALFLSPKCYIILDKTTNDKKIALKGITTRELEIEEFVSALYTGQCKEVKETRFQLAKSEKRIELVECQKETLNWLYSKLMVNDDFCSVSPLMINNELV